MVLSDKCSEFFDHHSKKHTQKGWCYIKDSRNVIKKINNLDEDVVGLYPSIPHKVSLRALRQDKKDDKTIPTEELLKMAW